mgnify:CR=1 FL=1
MLMRKQAGDTRRCLSTLQEFGGCRRYMPDSLTLPGDLSRPLRPDTFGKEYRELRRRRVLLDVPHRYC